MASSARAAWRKTQDVVRATLAPKYQGTLGLIDLLRADPVRWFVVFGSLSGRFGGVGQTDYALANDLAAKLVARLARQRPECRWVLMHWPGWSEIGMAVRPESRWSLEHNAGHQLMSPQEGSAHLVEELTAAEQTSEVVIVDSRELPPELHETRHLTDLPTAKAGTHNLACSLKACGRPGFALTRLLSPHRVVPPDVL